MKNLIFTLLLLCSASYSFAQNVPAYVPTNGLVGWWPFNGNANDESGNGNNGTVNGATLTTDRNGQVNKAYSFDGVSNIITFNSNFVFNTTSNGTFSLWYKNDDIPNQSYFTIFWSKLTTGDFNRFNFYIQDTSSTSNGLRLDYREQNSSLHNLNNTPLNYLSTNVWRNVIFVRNNNVYELFIDGNYYSSFTDSNPNLPNSIGWILGNNPNGQFFFKGKIDDIGFWNRALTPQEISDLYNSVNCANNLSISPTQNSVQRGNTATFTATTSDPNPSIIWQSDFGQGFVTLNDYGNYSGTNTATLNVSNVQLNNHTQPVRAISTSGNCVDTSTVALINVLDSCVTTVFDTVTTTVFDTVTTTVFDTVTTLISVTDTLIINAVISSVNPPNNVNTLLIYPNPANTHITIDNGNFATMAGYSVRINNALGQVVFNQNITQQQFFIDLSSWTGPGLYYVNILDPNGNPIEVKKIVIQ